MVTDYAEEKEELRLRMLGCFQAGVSDVEETGVPEDGVSCGLMDKRVVQYELTKLANRSPKYVARFALIRAKSP